MPSYTKQINIPHFMASEWRYVKKIIVLHHIGQMLEKKTL